MRLVRTISAREGKGVLPSASADGSSLTTAPAVMAMRGAMMTSKRQGNWAKADNGRIIQMRVEAGVVRKIKNKVIAWQKRRVRRTKGSTTLGATMKEKIKSRVAARPIWKPALSSGPGI